MVLKSIQAFVYENFLKLDLGDAATRASRLLTWRVNVTQAINPAGPHLINWWNWVQKEAEGAHKVFLKTHIMSRDSVLPTAAIPGPWQQLESWMRPKLMEVLPGHVREWVNQRMKQGVVDASHVLLFYLMKTFSPGGAEEKI